MSDSFRRVYIKNGVWERLSKELRCYEFISALKGFGNANFKLRNPFSETFFIEWILVISRKLNSGTSCMDYFEYFF